MLEEKEALPLDALVQLDWVVTSGGKASQRRGQWPTYGRRTILSEGGRGSHGNERRREGREFRSGEDGSGENIALRR
jgi:hypothetical protein